MKTSIMRSIFLVDTVNNMLFLEKIDGLSLKQYLWSVLNSEFETLFFGCCKTMLFETVGY
jgi:hypothetical protein